VNVARDRQHQVELLSVACCAVNVLALGVRDVSLSGLVRLRQ
jgi:hypothetical protein